MKVRVIETAGTFDLYFDAETIQDANWIARFANNVTSEKPSHGEFAGRDQTFTQWIFFRKKKNLTSSLSREA